MFVIDLLLVLLPFCLLAGAFVYIYALRLRRKTGLPGGRRIYADSGEERGQLLRSRRYGLRGRPDYLIHDGNAIIPVEVKTGRTPTAPYPNHIMQLLAYCLLVSDIYGIRPGYGVLRYEQAQFRINFSPEREEELLAVLGEMRAARHSGEQPRSHTNSRVCAGCGFRSQCDQRLA